MFTQVDSSLERSFHPDVVLLDIGLPKLNSYEAARRIREQEGGQGTMLVALAGWGQEEDRRRSKEAGFDRHLHQAGRVRRAAEASG